MSNFHGGLALSRKHPTHPTPPFTPVQRLWQRLPVHIKVVVGGLGGGVGVGVAPVLAHILAARAWGGAGGCRGVVLQRQAGREIAAARASLHAARYLIPPPTMLRTLQGPALVSSGEPL